MPERELRVLILDDDPDDVILLKDAIYDALDPTPMQLDHVARAAEAEELLKEGRYDLAFFDYHLGMETGLDLLKRFDREGPLPCPIILLTGQGNEEVAVEAMKSGASDYLIKDVLNPELIALTIRRTLRADDDRRRRREAEAALERLRRQYELILTSAGEGLIGLDRTGRITFANPAASALTGWEENRLKGRDAHRLLHRAQGDGECDVEPCPLRRSIESGRFTEGSDDAFARSDGITIPVRYVVTPIMEDGVRVGSVIVFSDTTVQRQAEEARRLAAERLMELEHLIEIDRFRSRFLDMAAQEMNGPLTPIKTQLHLIHRRGLERIPEDHRRSLEIVERNVDRLGRLVTDLQDVSRIQNDTLRLHKEDADVAELVRQVGREQAESAQEARLDLEVMARESLPLRVDPGRLHQAVENLVRNAIRFTPPGGKVKLSTESDADAVRVVIEDTGLGIEEEAIDRLFRPFGHAAEGHPSRGAGLGLAIARGIVEEHGGRVWVESEGPGKGSTFTIILPKAPLDFDRQDAFPESDMETGGTEDGLQSRPDDERRESS